MLTTEQIRNRTKDITRRRGWWFLKPGDSVCAVEKGMGLRRGEKIKRLAVLRIVDVFQEPLHCITQAEVVREGFPGMTPYEFVKMFCETHKDCNINSHVNRIQFEYIEG